MIHATFGRREGDRSICIHVLVSFSKRRLRGNLLHTSRHILRLGNLQFPHSQKDSPKQVASACLCCARKGVAQNRWLPDACAFLWSVSGGNLLRVCSLCRQTSPSRRSTRDGEKGEGSPHCYMHVMKMNFSLKFLGGKPPKCFMLFNFLGVLASTPRGGCRTLHVLLLTRSIRVCTRGARTERIMMYSNFGPS